MIYAQAFLSIGMSMLAVFVVYGAVKNRRTIFAGFYNDNGTNKHLKINK